MADEIDEVTRKRAKFPHELFMFNLAVFHLLTTPLAITLGLGAFTLVLPAGLSSLVLAYTWLRARRAATAEVPFVAGHWRLALRRYRLLFGAYGVTAAIIGGGILLGTGSANPNTRQILVTVFERIGIIPTLVTVLILFVLESSAIYQATRGELPGGGAVRPPPPAGE